MEIRKKSSISTMYVSVFMYSDPYYYKQNILVNN